MGVLGGGWTMESGGGQGRGGWIKESVNLVSVGGWVCVCVGVLSVGLGPGLDSMSPARSRRSASHAAGTHGWLPKNWEAGPPERRGRWIQFAQCSPEQSPRLWHCGTPTTSRLYPFGASPTNHHHHQYKHTAITIFINITLQKGKLHTTWKLLPERKIKHRNNIWKANNCDPSLAGEG